MSAVMDGSMVYCRGCGKQLHVTAVTCPQCGAPQQAAGVSDKKILPAFLLSGFAFAIANMPAPVRGISHLVPARYFVSLVKGVFLRGTGLETLGRDALLLVVFAVVLLALSIRLTRKRLR